MVFRQCRVPLNESHLSSPTLLRRKELRTSSRHELGDKPLSCVLVPTTILWTASSVTGVRLIGHADANDSTVRRRAPWDALPLPRAARPDVILVHR